MINKFKFILSTTFLLFFVQCISLLKGCEAGKADKQLSVRALADDIPDGMSAIYFHGVMSTYVYVNGVRVGSASDRTSFKKIIRKLSPGDVIGIDAYGSIGVYYIGVIASIVSRTETISTGSGKWIAAQRFQVVDDSLAFSKPDYNACPWDGWGAPVEVDNQYTNSKKSTTFPYQETGAKYVYPKDLTGWQRIYLRYRIGGESCTTNPELATIYVRNRYQEGKLYINGVPKMTVYSSYKSTRIFKLPLNKGDVIAIKIDARWYGSSVAIIAAIEAKEGMFSTGQEAWKAMTSSEYQGPAEEWTKPTYDACKWPAAQKLRYVSSAITSDEQEFPHKKTGAVYVGTSTRLEKTQSYYLRFRMGGEDCKTSCPCTCASSS